ncbi:MAG: hypothetical protein WA840_08210 [Caulobacteraceae bacterium]
MLHIIYRSYGGENLKGRPEYYSKLLALISMLQSLSRLGSPCEVIYLNDGPIPADRTAVMANSGEIVAGENLGSTGSMRAALLIPEQRGWASSDLVWFAEDDHLYLPDAFTGLVEASEAFPDAEYFGLYASIGRRAPEGTIVPDWAHVPAGWSEGPAVPVDGHTWRRGLSTTSTFGARVGAVRADRKMMNLVMRLGGAWDHTTCLMYQGYAPSSWKLLASHYGTGDIGPRWRVQSVLVRGGLNLWQFLRLRSGVKPRILAAPEPALATHLESEHMAAGSDWSSVARNCLAWGREKELIASPALVN